MMFIHTAVVVVIPLTTVRRGALAKGRLRRPHRATIAAAWRGGFPIIEGVGPSVSVDIHSVSNRGWREGPRLVAIGVNIVRRLD